jgi:predicted O-linked N-acetylglucosamine transferase (SPINDLY family)
MNQELFESAKQHHQAGRLVEAISFYRQVLAQQPNDAETLHLLGYAIYQSGRAEEGLGPIQRAIELNPNQAKYHCNLAVVLSALDRQEDSIAASKRAVNLREQFPEAWFNLANGYRARRQWAEAISAFRKALDQRPNWPEAHSNFGVALAAAGQVQSAVEEFQTALKQNPKIPIAWFNLGNALRDLGQPEPAIKAYQQAIAEDPKYLDAYNNLGGIYGRLGDYAQAAQTFRALLALQPDYVGAWINLGNALKDCAQYNEAAASFERALALDPQNVAARDNLIIATHYYSDDADLNLRLQQEWNRLFCQPLRAKIQPHRNDRSPDRRLRIGYVGADFREHACAHCLDPLLANHDHARFEIFCYANVPLPDAMTRRLQGYADHWCETMNLGDEELAERIGADQIDILVDLMLHTANNRLLVFARKPAPVQVSWLGYPGATGVETIDWRLSDAYMDPAPRDPGVIALPDCFWCYGPPENPPAVGALPALKNGYVTFGCLNNFCKVTDRTLELWAGTLSLIRDSRLLLLAPPGWPRRRLLEVLGRRGIESGRVEFIQRTSRAEYLKHYNRIDIGLDTLPYNGHTTSLDAFAMGVPVVTRVGKSPVSRAGWSQLNNLGKTDWAADSDEKFVSIAAELTGDLPRLALVRSELRERFRRSPLCDGPRFARGIESAYRQMWQAWSGQRR